MSKNLYSFYLFARPSFVEGMARVFDFNATMQQYNCSETETQADFTALSLDWHAVGEDILTSVKKYGS